MSGMVLVASDAGIAKAMDEHWDGLMDNTGIASWMNIRLPSRGPALVLDAEGCLQWIFCSSAG